MRRSLFLLIALACCSCASAVAVAPGHRAVMMDGDGRMAVLDEGVSAVPDGAVVDDFDLQDHVATLTMRAITQDGLSITVARAGVEYRLVPQEVVLAERSVGPRWPQLVEPIVKRAIGRVLATYRWDALDAPATREAQARITAIAAADLRPYHIAISAVDLKELTPAAPELAGAVTATSVWEQRSLEARSATEIARRQADALRERGAGIAAANAQVAPGLTPAVLADERQRALARLLASPTTTILELDAHSPRLEVTP